MIWIQRSKETSLAYWIQLRIFCNIRHIICTIAIPDFYNNSSAFKEIFNKSIKFSILGFISISLESLINAYLISKWKILLKGNFFWIRSVTSTALGEFVNTLVAIPFAYLGDFSSQEIMKMMIITYVIKILYGLITVYPAALTVSYLKNKKGIDYYDYAVDFNPFKFSR